jgi:hypothetical protein
MCGPVSRLSVDSYAPSRMSMDSNASYMLGGDPSKVGTPNLNPDSSRLSFDDSFQRMSLDHSHYSGSLGHQPLETVAEREELVRSPRPTITIWSHHSGTWETRCFLCHMGDCVYNHDAKV